MTEELPLLGKITEARFISSLVPSKTHFEREDHFIPNYQLHIGSYEESRFCYSQKSRYWQLCSYGISQNDIKDRYKEFNFETYKYNPEDNKTIRFQLPLDLQITITATGNGYIGIRHMDKLKLKDYCSESFPYKKILDELLIHKLGFYRNASYKMWIAVKEIEAFRDIESLATFIHYLHDELLSISMNNYLH